MPHEILLRQAAVVTVDPELGVLPTGDVLIRGDVIAAVGTDLLSLATPATEVVDARGMVALPGFVDAHLHAWEGVLRGAAPTVDFAGYLGITAFGHGARFVPADNYAGTLATALAALDAGITTVVDNGHNALTRDHVVASVEALADSGIRAVHAVGSPFGADLEHVPATAVAVRERYAGPRLDVRLFDVDPTPELWSFARSAGMWVSSEFGPHTAGLEDRVDALARAGLFTPEHALNHCYDLPERVWRVVADSGAAVNLCPRSDASFGLGSTLPPVSAATRYAAAVGLSNDNEISYPISMFAEMQTLLLRDRGEQFRRAAVGEAADDRRPLQVAQLVEYATQGGAHNAGLAGTVGSLTPGKQADVVLVRSAELPHGHVTDPVAAASVFAHNGLVDGVLVGGTWRKRDGRLIGVDLDAVRGLVDAARRRLGVDHRAPAEVPV